MIRKFPKLVCIKYDRKITKEQDSDFLHQLQSALLIALREQGILDEMQYRHAQERLDQQRRKENA